MAIREALEEEIAKQKRTLKGLRERKNRKKRKSLKPCLPGGFEKVKVQLGDKILSD